MSHSKETHRFATGQGPNAPHAGADASAMPTHEDIAKRAFDIYVKTGCKQGQCTQNWRQAEHDLRNGDRGGR